MQIAKILFAAAVATAGGCAGLDRPSPETVATLAPTGTLRVAVFAAPVFLVREGEGRLDGWAADLSRRLADRAGVPLEIKTFTNLRAFSDCIPKGECDLAWIGFDPRRTHAYALSRPVTRVANTFVVRADSPLRRAEEVDRTGVRVAVLPDTAAEAALATRLAKAELVRNPAFGKARLELLTSGRVDALAESRVAARAFAASSESLRVLDGHSHYTTYHAALPLERRSAAPWIDAVLEEAVNSGDLAARIQAHRQGDVEVSAGDAR